MRSLIIIDQLQRKAAERLLLRRAALTFIKQRLDVALLVYPDGILHPHIESAGQTKDMPETQESAVAFILRGWLESSGPITISGLAEKLAMPSGLIEIALARIEAEGQVLRGAHPPWVS